MTARLIPTIVLTSIALGAMPALAADAIHWKPAGIASSLFESHAAFDPRTGDLYFVRSSVKFQGWRILVSRCTDGGWSNPERPAFAGDGVEADPWFTADGRSLYFISTRSHDGAKGKDLDIWRVDRGEDGAWGAPVRLPEPVNSAGAEWFPRLAPDGWMYFGSDRPGGLGATDIWRARSGAGGRWTIENLGPSINTAGDEYEPLPSGDGTRLIVMADGALYESHRTPEGWSARVKLSGAVNANGTEIGAVFSPSGRSLLFSRDTKEPDSGEFFVWHETGSEEWPPTCPVAAKPKAASCPPGELIQWIADSCMATIGTDDEIAASDCIARESALEFSDVCAAKLHFKRALCATVIKNGARKGTVDGCVADPAFMGSTVHDGGVGARQAPQN